MGDHQLSPSPCSPSNGCSTSLGSETSFYSPISNQKMTQGLNRQLYYEESGDNVIDGYLQSDIMNRSPLMIGKNHSSTQVDLLQEDASVTHIDNETVSKANDAAEKKVDTFVKSFSQLDLKQNNTNAGLSTPQAKSVEDLWKFVDGMVQRSPSTSNVGVSPYYSFSPSSPHAPVFEPRAITGQPPVSPSFQPRPMHETYAMSNYQAWSALAQLQNFSGGRDSARLEMLIGQNRSLSRGSSHPASSGTVDCTGPTMPKFRQNYPFPKHILEALGTPKTTSETNKDRTQASAQDARYGVYDTSKLCTTESSNAVYILSPISNTSTPAGSQDFSMNSPMYRTVDSRAAAAGLDQLVPNMSPTGCAVTSHVPTGYSVVEAPHFSRKVFVGGLPPDIDEEEITLAFRRFGPLVVDWPHKADSKSYFPPKGYCFLLFQDEMSVQTLISSCLADDNKLYWCVSSPTMKDKPVQIRPWNIVDSDFVLDGTQPLDPRKTIFVGGVPRPLRAVELAMIMERLYGGVCYAGIDTDPELKYPKGAGRVAFSNQQSYIAAISARFVQLQHSDIDKRVEVKPYVLDDQLCDECQGARCGGKYAPFFCANVTCLQYYCELCWAQIHARPGREYHKPLVKEGTERPRSLPFRWY